MNLEDEVFSDLAGARVRTLSNDSQQSQPSSKNFPALASDSGLYTCSSDTSDCSLQLESDTEFCHQCHKIKGLKNERFQLALQDVRKLRSELERLSKSEQWYKQELRQQKSIRLDDLERIYTQERKFMQENQRLQKECVRLYEKCNELERELEKQNQDSISYPVQLQTDEGHVGENILEFEKDQQLAIIKDQQQLISVLRKQKRSLLKDLRTLTEEKDEKVMGLQHLLADLEFDNKLITKKCTELAEGRLNLENDLKQSNGKLSIALEEKMNLQKSIVELKEQLNNQQHLLKRKENEIEHIQKHYTEKIQQEEDLEQVHKLSIKYQEEVNTKTLEIINLKGRLQEMQNEMEDMQKIQEENELQQRQIDQLNFTIETYHFELQELKSSDELKNKQLDELHKAMNQLIKDKELVHKTTVEQQNDFFRIKQTLKATQEQYAQLQELYKKTQFQLDLLEIQQGKVKFQSDRDRQEINYLRNKLKVYFQQTIDLTEKIQYLENELAIILKENSKLKQDSDKNKKTITDLEAYFKDDVIPQTRVDNDSDSNFSTDLCLQKSLYNQQGSNKDSDDQDFLVLQQQCESLLAKLDFFKNNQQNLENDLFLHTINNFLKESNRISSDTLNFNESDILEKDEDLLNVSAQGKKLQENLDILKYFLKEKHCLLSYIVRMKNSNEGKGKLVKENEILKKKLSATEEEAIRLQIKENINEETKKYSQMKENLEIHIEKVTNLQENLLKNDGKLYKLEKKVKTLDVVDDKLLELKLENTKLKKQLKQEKACKTDLNIKLGQETEKLEHLKQSLTDLEMKPKPIKNQATQCVLTENPIEEVKKLKEHILQLEEQLHHFAEKEANKKAERLHFLHQMMVLQNDKMQNLQKHQKDWEDILTSLNSAHVLEEKTRKELELKRMELEELNQVFAQQNEEFRKLEEFTALLELKSRQEKEQLKLTFQQETNVMKCHLQECQQEIEHQKVITQQLEKQNQQFQADIKEDYGTEVAGYKNEIGELKSRISKLMEEKEELLENLNEMKKETKDIMDIKREAILMPDFNLVELMDSSINNPVESVEVIKETISEDHLNILTKVLQAEYQRKKLRYDEYIESLLSNVKSLKKSLKANEQKTALLIEEQENVKEELNELQNTKRNYEEMRLKYEHSQNIIKELKHSLALERKKNQLSDIGNFSQTSAYEVSNLIDDYKKLIQQSAVVTKRPCTSAVLDLIQRSNQYVPNLKQLENNVEGLRSELHNFLTCYSHKIPATSLIATASLSVPPSLMDELKAAATGF